MAVTFHNDDCGYTLRGKRKISDWIRRVVADEGFSVGDISIVLCSDRALLDVNRKFLGHDYFTDIITFDYSSGGVLSGDLMISVDTVADNAASLNTGFTDELHRVIIHGVLHLCGHGDKSEEEQKEMRSSEDKYLERL